MNPQIKMHKYKKVTKRHLPRLVSVSVTVAEAVAQGQKPAHMMFRSLPVRQACCSSLHCKQRERATERQRQRDRGTDALKIFMGVTAGKRDCSFR